MKTTILSVCCAVIAFHVAFWSDSASRVWAETSIEMDDDSITVRTKINFPANPSQVPDELLDAAGAQSLVKAPNNIVVRVVDENANPIAGVELILSRIAADGTRTQLTTAKTDSDGRHEFEQVINIKNDFEDGIIPAQMGLSGFSIELAARASDRVSYSSSLSPAAIARQGEVQLIRMPAAATICGKITDSEGKPVQGAVVSIWNPLLSALRSEVVFCGRTDADGSYEINDVAAFSFSEHSQFEDSQRRRDPENPARPAATSRVYVVRPLMRVDHPGFAVKHSDFENIPGEKDIQLGPSAELEGSVVYDDLREPATGVLVTVTSMVDEQLSNQDQALSNYAASAFTDRDGKYRFGNLPPGHYQLWATSDGWVNPGEDNLGISARTPTTAPELKLTKGGLVKTRLVALGSEEPLKLPPNAQLVYAVHPVDRPGPSRSQLLTAFKNDQGEFEFHVLPGTSAFQFVALEANGYIIQHNAVPNDVQTVKEGEILNAVISLDSEEVQSLFPADERALAIVKRAEGLMSDDEFQAAIKLLKPFVEEHPEFVPAGMTLASAYELSGQVRRAEDEYDRILEIAAPAPFNYLARNNLAFLLATATEDSLRDGQRAVRLAQEAISLSQGAVPDLYDTLAAAHAEAGDMEQAEDAMQIALETAPKSEFFREHLELYRKKRALRIERPMKGDDSTP